jgi:hypothetical protein
MAVNRSQESPVWYLTSNCSNRSDDFIIYPDSVKPSTKSQLLFNKIKISTHIPLYRLTYFGQHNQYIVMALIKLPTLQNPFLFEQNNDEIYCREIQPTARRNRHVIKISDIPCVFQDMIYRMGQRFWQLWHMINRKPPSWMIQVTVVSGSKTIYSWD